MPTIATTTTTTKHSNNLPADGGRGISFSPCQTPRPAGNPFTSSPRDTGIDDVFDLLHGDCLERMRGLPDNSVDMVLADPPYGTTACKWDSVIPFEPMWEHLKRVTKKNGAIVMTAQAPFDKVLGVSNIAHLRYEWVWQKESGTGHLNAKKAPMKNHENILVFYAQPPTYNPQMRTGFKPYTQKQGSTKSQNYGHQTGAVTVSDGTRYPLTVIEVARDKGKTHPTQKPVALMEYLIKTYTNDGESVLDFTMGSGTTGVACMNLGRRFTGIELDPTYFDIAASRITTAYLAKAEEEASR